MFQSLETGHLEYLPETLYTMLSVSVNYNIPSATKAVMDAAASGLADAAELEFPGLDRQACGLELAR